MLSGVVKERQGQNYLVLTKDGQEHILDKAKSSYNDISEIGNILVFNNLKFSSTGRFLVYGSSGWEWYFVKIVDTQNLKNVKLDLPSASTIEFNSSDNKLFTCAQNEMSGDSYTSGFDLKTLKVVKDFLKDSIIDSSTGVNINCRFDRNTQTAIVKLSPWDESKSGQNMGMAID